MTATWQAYHQITGAPLTADDAPSTTAPDAARVFKAPHTVKKVLVQLLDGTSATAAVWTCDDGDDPTVKGNWSALAGATGSIGTTLPLPLAVTPKAYITIRLTDVVGSPTACVVLDFACFPDILKALCTRSALSIDSATLHADVDGVETLIGATNTAVAALTNALKSNTSGVLLAEHDTNTFTATRGITVSGSGDLVVQFADDGATVTIAVVPGYYPYSIILLHTDTDDTLTIHAHY